MEKFSWKRSKCEVGSIYLVKPLYRMTDSTFLRKFAQVLSIGIGQGGPKLQLHIESPADHCRP